MATGALSDTFEKVTLNDVLETGFSLANVVPGTTYKF